MKLKIKVFSYSQLDTFVHRLSGLSKLVCFLLLTTAVMITYDIRMILLVMAISIAVMAIAKVRYRQIRLMVIYVLIFLVANFILTFLFAPEYGVQIYGTRHVLFSFGGIYVVTQEQMFYQITQFAKYLSVIPLGMIFFLTTNPSEFASSLNSIGVSYKVCTSLSLTLRYFPDVQRDYHSISLAQQARGIDMSKKAKAGERLKNITAILTPLIFTTMDRIELISNAMDLRGFGKSKTRTWYCSRPLKSADYLSMLGCLLMLILIIYVRVAVNHSIYYHPFIH